MHDKNQFAARKNKSNELINDSSTLTFTTARVDDIDHIPLDGPLVDNGAKYSAVEIVEPLLFRKLFHDEKMSYTLFLNH